MDKARHIDILLFDDLNILDVAGPVQAFSSANHAGPTRYHLRYVTLDGQGARSSCGLQMMADAALTPGQGQDLLIPGGRGVDALLHQPALQQHLRTWHDAGPDRRVMSICSGALLLADAGLLTGRPATTHWSRTAQVHSQFPDVDWRMDDLYRIKDRIMTSAGVTSGIDLALEVIRRDHGATVALAVARELVVFLKRSGGQNQFADMLAAQFTPDTAVARLITALQERPGDAWTLDRMADTAGLTTRTLVRRFSDQTGLSPVKFLERYRVKRACDGLSAGLPMGQCITVSGFRDFQQMQRAFKRQMGTTVGRYAARFG